MDKKSLLALFLIFIVILLYEPYKNLLYPPSEQPVETGDMTMQEIPAADSAAGPAEQPAVTDQRQETTAQDMPSGIVPETSDLPEEAVVIETPLYRGVLSTKGGTVSAWYMKEYTNHWGEQVNIIKNNEKGNLSLFFMGADGSEINLKDYDFVPDGLIKREDGYFLSVENSERSITLTADLGNNSFIHKKFTIDPFSYNVMMELVFENCHTVIGRQDYELTWGSGIRASEMYNEGDAPWSKSLALFGDEIIEFDAGKNPEMVRTDLSTGTIHWFATRSKYFTALVAPVGIKGEAIRLGGYYDAAEMVSGPKNYITSMRMGYDGSNSYRNNFLLYMGPIEFYSFKDVQERIGGEYSLSKVVFDVNFVIRPLSTLIYRIFSFLHDFIPNYGVVIILFSLIINILMFPLTAKSYKSMKKMQDLQPLMNDLKEKYKDNPQRMQEEQIKLYKELQINPVSGCLPLFMQMPVFFAIYPIFRTIELRGAEFIFWVKDLSQPDTVAHLPFSIPFFGDAVNILTIIYAISLFIQQKIMMKDPKQRALVYIMPIMLLLMLNRLSSGFILYFIIFNLLSIGQRYMVRDDKEGGTEKAVEKLQSKISPKKGGRKKKK